MPCEIEALSIAAAVKHFAPYIIQSKSKSYVLTDSKPCVQAFDKLCHGQISSSPRVTSFLSSVSRYQVALLHLAGSANLPSDFAGRNAPACDDPRCQVCSFVSEAEDLAVRPISVHDVLSGKTSLPFTSRSAWLQSQLECPDLRRVHSHLKLGTRPSKKMTNIKDVKRYLNLVSISRDGLLVVKRDEPFAVPRECIVIPRSVVDGFLAALHVTLGHPFRHQMKLVSQRYFFALDLDKALDRCWQCCHLCSSLKKVPSSLVEQSTSDPPDGFGISFAADDIKRYRQLILVVRETSTSFTASCLLDDERRDSIRSSLLRLCLELRPLSGPPSVIRVDPAPGFASLCGDEILRQYGFAVEIGRVKNPNKNPVAEKCVAELGDELLRICPEGGTITPLSLAVATANLNTRSTSYRVKLSECYRVPNQTETTSNLSRRYSSDSYLEDIADEPLTSGYVDKEPAHVPTPQSTPDPVPALVPSELATPPDPQSDINPTPESSPLPDGSVFDVTDAPISESAFSSGPRRSSRPTRRPSYLKDYVT